MSNSAFGPVLGSTINSSTHMMPTKDEQALGLKAIYAACRALYPDQPTPLQVTAVRKFWMGGPDPLDFINMYANPGCPELQSPSHWHYITNGLSDLYGDSRLHNHCNSTDGPSGFGFELTLRVRREPNETNPPTWPAHLLQSLARYVFYSQAQLMAGDHIPWPSALDKQPHMDAQHQTTATNTSKRTQPESNNNEDSETTKRSIAMAAAATAASILAANGAKTGSSTLSALSNPATYESMVAAALAAVNSTSENSAKTSANAQSGSGTSSSRIHHMLLVEDPQLKKLSTPYGYVQFLQLVGLCDEELKLVQRWTASHVADLMSRLPETGGGLLVTDMRRTLSLFELQPSIVDYVNEKLRREGSNLSGVTTAYFAWASVNLATIGELLPGELESRRQRRQAQRRNSSLSGNVQSSGSGRSSKGDLTSRSMFCGPTDLSVQRNNEPSKSSDNSTAMEAVAMETDETVVSASNKKQSEDEDFIDIVGDEGLVRIDEERLPTSHGDKVSPHESPSLKMSRFAPAHRGAIGGSFYKQSYTPNTPPDSFFNSFYSKPETQPISAPGGFSAWCARLGPSQNNALQPSHVRQNINKTAGSSPSVASGSGPIGTPTEVPSIIGGALGFRAFNTDPSGSFMSDRPIDLGEAKGSRTPGSTGDGSAPCTPLAHLSLSPASLDLLPTRIIDYLDVHLCREAGEMLPLAVNDRLRHGRHFTFLNANFPDHAITLVPSGVSGAFVTEETPYVARGPWLQILLTDDFLEQLEFQFSCLLYTDDLKLPLVFRWPERHLRICLVDASANVNTPAVNSTSIAPIPHSLLPKAAANPNTNVTNTNIWNVQNASPDKVPLSAGTVANSVGTPSTSRHFSPQTPPFNPNSDSISPFLSLFPPGCIPPPNVLAAFVSAASNAHRQNLQPELDKSQTTQSPDALNPNWTSFMANAADFNKSPSTNTSRQSQPFTNLVEVMQAAFSAFQQQGTGSSIPNMNQLLGINFNPTNPSPNGPVIGPFNFPSTNSTPSTRHS